MKNCRLKGMNGPQWTVANVVTLVSKTDAAALTQWLAGAAVRKVHVIAPSR